MAVADAVVVADAAVFIAAVVDVVAVVVDVVTVVAVFVFCCYDNYFTNFSLQTNITV